MIPPADLLACISRRPSNRISLTLSILPRRQSSVPTFSRIGASWSCNRSSTWVYRFHRRAKPTDVLFQDVFQPFHQHNPRHAPPVPHRHNQVFLQDAWSQLQSITYMIRRTGYSSNQKLRVTSLTKSPGEPSLRCEFGYQIPHW